MTGPSNGPEVMGLREDAAAIAGELAELRHAIHREPEIGLDLPLTQAKVLAALDGLPLEISTGRKLSSVTAVLRGGADPAALTWRADPRARPVVLLRGDMDALPVTEATGLPTAPGSTGSCTPAATTCTRPCWPGRPGCSAPAGPNCPAT